MARQGYPSDLTDAQWELISPLIPRPKSGKAGGRPRTSDMREVVNAILYLNRSGGSWRMLPHDFPLWPTVHDYYRKWRRDGMWKKLHDALRENVRVEAGREASPSAGILDRQSVKTAAPEKKGRMGTTQTRKSRDASVISWSTRWACFWPSWSMGRISRIGTAPGWYCGNCGDRFRDCV